VSAGIFLSSTSWSGSIHSHPQRVKSIKSHLTPLQATCLIRADPMSVVRRNSLLQWPAARFNTFCLWNSVLPLSIASLTVFDHAVTHFTPLSDHSCVILVVRGVHCRHSGCNCRAFSAWESARSLTGSPRCALTLMNVRAPRITLSFTHSTIVVMMSAFASHASVVRGPL
jgi:hypothetical protein